MPTYQYRCKSCSHEFEEIQKISDKPKEKCPKCKKKVQRLITGTSFVLKGENWFKSGGY